MVMLTQYRTDAPVHCDVCGHDIAPGETVVRATCGDEDGRPEESIYEAHCECDFILNHATVFFSGEEVDASLLMMLSEYNREEVEAFFQSVRERFEAALSRILLSLLGAGMGAAGQRGREERDERL